MNRDTGELYENRNEALEKLLLEGMDETIAENKLIPLDHEEFIELKGMNRAERRRWAREHKVK